MDIRGKKFVVIGGAGLIGSHAVDLLTRQDVGQIVIYDNFMRGTPENIASMAVSQANGLRCRAAHASPSPL